MKSENTESFQVLDVQYKQQVRNRKLLGQDLSIKNLYLLYKPYQVQRQEMCLPLKH